MDWTSSLAPQGMGDEAPGVFTITDRKVTSLLGSISSVNLILRLQYNCCLLPFLCTGSGVQVRGGDDPFDIPIYTLCRRWVRNDPYNDEATLAVAPVLTLLTTASSQCTQLLCIGNADILDILLKSKQRLPSHG